MIFPDNPTVGDLFSIGPKTWEWTGTSWDLIPMGNDIVEAAEEAALRAEQSAADAESSVSDAIDSLLQDLSDSLNIDKGAYLIGHRGSTIGDELDDLYSLTSPVSDRTIRVPEDFPTLNDVFENYHPANGEKLNIIISSGYKLPKGLKLLGGDYSKISISSDDEVVEVVDAGFIPVGASSWSGENLYSYGTNFLFYAQECIFPRINILVDLKNETSGILLCGSKGLISPSKGFRNAIAKGALLISSDLYARECEITSSGEENIRVRMCSRLVAGVANFDDGVTKQTSDHPAVFISRGSVAYLNGATARNSGNYAVSIHRSDASIEGMDATGARTIALEIDTGSRVCANTFIANNAGGSSSVRIQRSFVELTGASILNAAGTPLSLRYGAVVSANSLNVDDVNNFSNVIPNMPEGRGILLCEDKQSRLIDRYTTPVVGNLDNLRGNVVVRTNNSSTNLPPIGGNFWLVHNMDNETDRRVQLAMNVSGALRMYYRVETSGGWQPWIRVQTGPVTSISSTPEFVGQFAVVSGIGYMATGTSSTSDWKQITNV